MKKEQIQFDGEHLIIRGKKIKIPEEEKRCLVACFNDANERRMNLVLHGTGHTNAELVIENKKLQASASKENR